MERIFVASTVRRCKYAMAWAVEEARLRRAEREVVHAWHAPYVAGPPFGPSMST